MEKGKPTKSDEKYQNDIREELAEIKIVLQDILAAQTANVRTNDKKTESAKSLEELADIFFKNAGEIKSIADRIAEPEKKTQYLKNTLAMLREVKEAIKEFPSKIAVAVKAKAFGMVDKALNSVANKLDNGAKYLQNERDRVLGLSPLEKAAHLEEQKTENEKYEKTITEPSDNKNNEVENELNFYKSYIEADSSEKRYLANYKENNKFFYRQTDADKQFMLDELKYHNVQLSESSQVLTANSPAALNPTYAKQLTVELMQSSVYKEIAASVNQEKTAEAVR